MAAANIRSAVLLLRRHVLWFSIDIKPFIEHQSVCHTRPAGATGLRVKACESASKQSFATQTPAACVPPGARLRLRDIPEHLRQKYSVGMTEGVTFVQLSATPYQYRDAVHFNNGWETRLQELEEGMRADVLPLSSRDHEHEAHHGLEKEYQPIFL
jgi:hypothetical protein